MESSNYGVLYLTEDKLAECKLTNAAYNAKIQQTHPKASKNEVVDPKSLVAVLTGGETTLPVVAAVTSGAVVAVVDAVVDVVACGKPNNAN